MPASGVPSIGLRKLSGIDSTPSSRSANAISTTSCVALAHADDAAASTAAMPRVAHVAQRLDAVLIGVRRADLRIEPLAGVEVVVHLVHAAGLQPPALALRVNRPRQAQTFRPYSCLISRHDRA